MFFFFAGLRIQSVRACVCVCLCVCECVCVLLANDTCAFVKKLYLGFIKWYMILRRWYVSVPLIVRPILVQTASLLFRPHGPVGPMTPIGPRGLTAPWVPQAQWDPEAPWANWVAPCGPKVSNGPFSARIFISVEFVTTMTGRIKLPGR